MSRNVPSFRAHRRRRRVEQRVAAHPGEVEVSLIEIGLCFTALSLTPVIAPCFALAVSVLGVAVFLGVVCLVLYRRLMTSVMGLLWPA